MLVDIVREGRIVAVANALQSHLASQEELSEALLEAIRSRSAAFVSLLLEGGADPNRSYEGRSPLVCAVEHEQLEIVRLLIENGANVNSADESGFTPLHLAVDIEADGAYQAGREPTTVLTALLLRYGADPGLPDQSGQTPLRLAEEYGHIGAVGLLRRKLCCRGG